MWTSIAAQILFYANLTLGEQNSITEKLER